MDDLRDGDGASKNRCAVAARNAKDYFHMLTAEYEVIICLSVVFCFVIIALFFGKIFVIFHYVSSYRRAGFMIWLCAIFPITAVVSTVSIIIPRSMAISNMFIFLYFARSLFTFVELVIDYFGGRIEMAKELAGNEVKMNIPPCCCCCPCLPTMKASPQNLRRLGIYVYQTALINPGIYFVAAVVWTDQLGLSTSSGTTAANWFLPLLSAFSFVSTMTAMYGINLYARMSAGALQGYCLLAQVRFMQIMLLLYNLQDYIFTTLASYGVIRCDDILPANAKSGLYSRFALVVECCVLSLLSAFFLRPQVNATFDLHPARNRFRQRKPAFSISDPRPLRRVRGSICAESISDALAHPQDISYYYEDPENVLAQLKEQEALKGPNYPVRKRSISTNSGGFYTRRMTPAIIITPTASSSPGGIIKGGLRASNSAPDMDALKRQRMQSRHRIPDSILETDEEADDGAENKSVSETSTSSRMRRPVSSILEDDVFEETDREMESESEEKPKQNGRVKSDMYLNAESLKRYMR